MEYLYLTGYLTKVRDRDIKMPLPDGMTALLIPNAEIREIFETTVKNGLKTKPEHGIKDCCLMLSGVVIARP